MKTYKPNSKLTLFKLDKTRLESETVTYSLVDFGPIAYIKVGDYDRGDDVIKFIAKKLNAEIMEG